MKVEVESEDIEWMLTMPGWELTHEAVKKTEEVSNRLWNILGVTNKMEQTIKGLKKRKEVTEAQP